MLLMAVSVTSGKHRRARKDDITPEFRQKMSELKSGPSGRSMPPQTRAALLAARLGKKMPPEAIARMVATRRNLPGGYAGRKSRTFKTRN